MFFRTLKLFEKCSRNEYGTLGTILNYSVCEKVIT